MTAQEIISVIGLLGIGAIIQSIINSFLKKRETQHQKEHEFKEVRYKATILLMYSMLDFERHRDELRKHGRNFTNKEQLMDEIKTEWNNLILFGSDKVITSIKSFIQNPTEQNFLSATIAMRQDLYGLKTRLKPEDLRLIN